MNPLKIERVDRTRWLIELYLINNIPIGSFSDF